MTPDIERLANETSESVPAEWSAPGARLIVVSGLSGAGTTTALHALEDIGYFAVDNLPPSLWAPLAARAEAVGKDRVALSVDVRTSAFLGELDDGLAALAQGGFEPTILFLSASEQTLVKRYSLTRRTHPLNEGTLSHDIAAERVALEGVRRRAHHQVDTTGMSAKELNHYIRRSFARERSFLLRLVSFGFKRGAPIDADLVLDVRALPNPYYEEALRRLSGSEAQVQAHVFTPGGLELYTQLRNLVRTLAGLARDSGRTSYTVALGCTGGQHRSVAVAERLSRDLGDQFDARMEHRDLAAALAEHDS
ncbi:MAG TPA: RNase adapter RapZ [Trueperaceae bacterium]